MKYKYDPSNHSVSGVSENEAPAKFYSSLPEYPLQGEKPGWWPAELELSKHFTVETCCEMECDGTCEVNGKTVWAIPLPEPEKQEESEDDIWEDVYIMFQSWANSADTFGEHIENLKSRFTITRKNNSQ